MPANEASLLRRAVRVAGSVPVGLTLMALLAAYVGLASVWPGWLAWLLGTRPQGVYRHWLPVTLGALLCASILLTTITRIPLRLRHAGAWCSHAGVLVLAAGSAWYALGSVSGYCVPEFWEDPPELAADEKAPWVPIKFLYVDDTYTAYLDFGGGELVQTPLAGLDPLKTSSDHGDVEVEYRVPLAGAPPGVSVRTLRYGSRPKLGLAVDVRGELWSSEAWVEFTDYVVPSDLVGVNLPAGGVRLGFSRQRLPLPAPVRLLDAEHVTYPGSVVPKDYRCKVRIGSGDGARTETISLNHPIYIGPYQISQGTWLRDRDSGLMIVFGVQSRPGLPLIWAGLAMIVAGMIFGFYVKPLALRRRAKVQP